MRANQETRERWQNHVKDFRASGLSRIAYCQKHQINVSTLDYWRQKLEPVTKSKAQESNWIPVKIAENGGQSIEMRIGRISLTVQAGFDRALLIELLQTIALC